MARCEIVPIKISEVQLCLTWEEASTMKQILRNVGGNLKGPHRFIANILTAMDMADVSSADHKLDQTADSIYYED